MFRRLAVLLAAAPIAVATAPPSSAAELCSMPSSEVPLDAGLYFPPDYGRVEIRIDSFICSVDLLFRTAACGDGGVGYGTVSWNDRTENVRAQWVGTTIAFTGGAIGELGVSYDVTDCATAEGARSLTVSGLAVAV